MGLYSDPPPLHTFDEDKPTLLVCWWITLFCSTIILLRVGGRFVRSEKLFTEDKTAFYAIIPLWLRMGCVHVVLTYGTNNAQIPADFSDDERRKKAIASGLVLASRMFDAATLWILKSAVLDFFKRLTSITWKQSHRSTLLAIRIMLGATFVGILIADLAECQPFDHYYQVLPDPGGQCRQGFAQLITMAACNIVTDLSLVLFPVPIILASQMTVKRKLQLVMLFSLSLGVVGVTLYKVPRIIWAQGDQQMRSLLASVELLFATAASNSLVLGSFVRDRGVKKAKYRRGESVGAESLDGSIGRSMRRPTMQQHWGSDEDLVRDLGLGVDADLRESVSHSGSGSGKRLRPAPTIDKVPEDMKDWQFPERKRSNAERSDDSLLPADTTSGARSNSTSTQRRVSFFDVGGLLSPSEERSTRGSFNSGIDPMQPHPPPQSTVPAPSSGFRRGSQVVLQDIGGLLSPPPPKSMRSNSKVSTGTELETIPQHPREPPDPYHNTPTLMDPGGLLR